MGTQAQRRVIAAACVALSIAALPAGQTPDSLNRARGAVVMIRSQIGGASAIGAGLVVAASAQDVYVTTANHLVRRGGTAASSIRLQFSSRPGEWFDAKLLELGDPDLDLAVVLVRIPGAIDTSTLAGLGAAQASLLTRGSDVYPMGFPAERAWSVPVAPDKVDRTTALRVMFQSQYVRPGNSGGALLDSCGRIVGMVTSVEPPDAEAVRIESVLEAARGWSLPGSLTLKLSSSRCGAAGPMPDVEVPAAPAATAPSATCEVSVSSTPSEAAIYLNDDEEGTTPRKLTLTRGRRYDLRVEKEGFEAFSRQIDCASGTVRTSLRAGRTSITLAYQGDFYSCVLHLQVQIGSTTVNPTSNPYRVNNVTPGAQPYRIGGQITCPIGVCAAQGQGTINVRPEGVYNLMWLNTAYGQCQVSLIDPLQ